MFRTELVNLKISEDLWKATSAQKFDPALYPRYENFSLVFFLWCFAEPILTFKGHSLVTLATVLLYKSKGSQQLQYKIWRQGTH